MSHRLWSFRATISCMQVIRQSYKQSLSKSNHIREVQALPSPPTSNNPESINVCAFNAPLALEALVLTLPQPRLLSPASPFIPSTSKPFLYTPLPIRHSSLLVSFTSTRESFTRRENNMELVTSIKNQSVCSSNPSQHST